MNNISEIISAVSVLLVFLTFLLNVIEKEVNLILSSHKPPLAQGKARKVFNINSLKLLLLKLFPISIVFSITFFLFLPQTLQILMMDEIDFWNFNVLRTIFIYLEIGLLGLVVFSYSKFYLLIIKILDKK